VKEPVRRIKRPWLVYAVVAAIAALYFGLLAKHRYPEPGDNLRYDISEYESADNVETRWAETGRLTPVLEEPRALTALSDGRVLVGGVDEAVFLDAAGTETGRFTLQGTATALTQAPDGEILVALENRIATFDSQGQLKADWDELDAKAYITSLAADAENVYAADAGNRVVYRFDRTGALLNRIGEADPDRDIKGLVVPSPYFDVALNDEGTLWVVNPGELGLESYRPGGDLITSWYNPSMRLDGFCGCCNPSHVAFMPDGRLVTCEKGLVRVKLYEVTAGEYLELVAGTAAFPKEEAVRDLAVDAAGRILVLDPRHDAVRVFEVKEGEDG